MVLWGILLPSKVILKGSMGDATSLEGHFEGFYGGYYKVLRCAESDLQAPTQSHPTATRSSTAAGSYRYLKTLIPQHIDPTS